jgi:hypothetical protein
MGHSYLTVSLNYLRGLEVSELEEEDIPIAYSLHSPSTQLETPLAFA